MSEFSRINTATAHQLWQSGEAAFADIRDERSFALGHIPGAVHLTDASLIDFLGQIDDDQPVVVVCYHGNSSQGAAQYLAQQGVEPVSSLDGGFTAWAQLFPDAVERN
ncbi:Thiosulfate sulfurtransferase GlpE [Pseudidiomarina piscicola]|uniref:Thiosulfate sulfurtransferase GlpE n=1 Tax=Pseudidiomarina piscicola TaxID=2614830 RepID=A0A6S6WJ68_9GAMM|nr:thiosulfate sulfurtransferase GlpE [Pseudidiomarina piscicola]CAB0150639.1 Thiosulfate sulfurtransferase GlpE [Pseudidiomarina piscicola]VZT40142.1 Thiosulfate sulfurtransferase GlpE [Pseudomonas aeruginosa]